MDIDGKPVKTWITTYVLIDSIAALKSKAGLDNVEMNKDGDVKYIDQISGNIEAMREAKANTDFILKIKPILNKYGICLISINNFVQENQMSMFDVLKKYLPMLKPGQRPKGGKELIFQAYAIGNLEPKEKINEKNPVYGEDIYGVFTNFAFVKSKTSEEGVYYRMVFDTRTGYKPDLSDFEYLMSHDYGIDGSIKMTLKVLPEYDFSRKTLYNLCRTNPLFSRALKFTAKIKIAYDLILRDTPPDLSKFGQLPLAIRAAIIVNYTDPYPGMQVPFDIDTKETIALGTQAIMNEKKNLSAVLPTEDFIDWITPDADGLSFMPLLKFEQYLNPDKYHIEKDKDLGLEFWFTKEFWGKE
jgi:hypothetical protein